MPKFKFDGQDIDTHRKFFSVRIPKWIRRRYGRYIRRFGVQKGTFTRLIIVEPFDSLNYREALAAFRIGEIYQFANELESCEHYWTADLFNGGIVCEVCGIKQPEIEETCWDCGEWERCTCFD